MVERHRAKLFSAYCKNFSGFFGNLLYFYHRPNIVTVDCEKTKQKVQLESKQRLRIIMTAKQIKRTRVVTIQCLLFSNVHTAKLGKYFSLAMY